MNFTASCKQISRIEAGRDVGSFCARERANVINQLTENASSRRASFAWSKIKEQRSRVAVITMLHYASNHPLAHPPTFSLDLIAIWYRCTLTRRSVKMGEKGKKLRNSFHSRRRFSFLNRSADVRKTLNVPKNIQKLIYLLGYFKRPKKHQKTLLYKFNLRKWKIWKMRWKMFNYSDVILFIINRKIVK